MSDVLEKYRQFESAIIRTIPGANTDRIRSAFEFARLHHGTQLRKDGTEFVTHPLAVAEIVLEIGLDEDSLCAAFLHDCIEDTDATFEEIEKLFGPDVAIIVDGVTKLTRVTYTSKEEEQMENLRKMLIAMVRDIRVILIKIADRLHNMRTIEYQTAEKQREKALETMEIYAPIAHRLGMQKIKWELEDLSIDYLDPIGCGKIKRGLRRQQARDESFLSRVREMIQARLLEEEIKCKVEGRIKHLYSIYRKMYEQNKELAEVLDLYAFRVIVDDIEDCYYVMGLVHELFHPIPGKIKDYISTPKPNDYRSLHTSVIGSEGVPFEVQIRTVEMHQTAEYGIAAHWKYKEGREGKVADEEKFAWVRRQLESYQESDAQDFFQALKIDMFADEVFVYTPGGDVVSLPAGATPIDFAYSIHSAIGNTMTGAIVNRRMVTFSHILQNGDIVEILTSKSSKGPTRDWLNMIKSTEARNKIRQFFKKEKREENILHGKMNFEAELKRQNLQMSDVLREDVLPKALARVSFSSLEDMFAAIGYGGVSSQKAVNKIREEIRNADKLKKKEPEPEPSPVMVLKPPREQKAKPVKGVMVESLPGCLVKFAKCCAPVPGDPIIGFVTRGFGVSVHRQDCVNYLRSKKEPDRWVNSTWADTESGTYSTEIQISASDRKSLAMDIMTVLNALDIKIESFSARNLGDGTAFISATIEVKNRDELVRAMARLMSVQGVTDTRRVDG
ncbi:MAG: bifunctional (p)ppGpp synthetase/guanosine-3',5'-bis(diphosphate) 3'-pyrophosphohydrolase [Oscillospiraceae bacterium]|nr:bifunctional (p)ppGpp synthetase/guanosine-3',5'-bis(diphosphate) 3'-pyrophosphohydrolase [Oscillospiraceae bacterium]